MIKKITFLVTIVFILLLSSCKSTENKSENTPVSDKIIETTEVENNTIENYFKGTGTEPFWGLKISNDMIEFTSLVEGFESFKTPHVEPILAADANVKMYRVTTESVSMRIEIIQGECSDNMSDNIYSYKVTVEITRSKDKAPTLFKGCGNYITDYRLNDLWVLEEIQGSRVIATNGKELPNMEINSAKNNFSGYAGCNRMSGQIFSEKKLIRFQKIAVTKMMCPDDQNEVAFLKALQKVTQYEIKNNRLYLSNPDEQLLVFKKID